MSENPSATVAPITALSDLLLRHQPPGHARMTEPGYTAKYLRVAQPITDADLAAHLAGDITLACVLQHDGLAAVAAVDLDEGGEAMVRKVMRIAELHACHAYGFVLASGSHDGGHVWIFFDQLHPTHDLQNLMRDIVTEAGCPSSEIYPSGADLRLPFGLHRRCNRRGTLLLNSAAQSLDLDADLAGSLATFFAQLHLTSSLPVHIAQEAQAARRRAVAEAIAAARPRRTAPDAHWRDVIAHFNASTDLVSLLERYGARAVYHYAGGKVLLRCACGHDHKHGDSHPSLVVEPGRKSQIGKQICGCYSPSCRLHNQPGQVMDAFEVFCRLEGISKREAVQRLQTRDSVVPADCVRPQVADCIQKTIPNRAPTLGRSDAPTFQRRLMEINTDGRAQPLDRRLLAYVIAHGAQGQGLANAALATALGARPDSIKRSKRRLRELGYINVTISTDGITSSTITIINTDPVSSLQSPVSSLLLDETANCQLVTADSFLERGHEGGVQLAPPSHVTESTCVDATPPPESEPELIERAVGEVSPLLESVPSAPQQPPRPESALRRRRAVLQNMLRAGVPERRRLAFTAELKTIEARLSIDTLDTQITYQQPIDCQLLPATCHLPPGNCLASPSDPHPPLTDGQLTALLRDSLIDTIPADIKALLDRVSWHQQDEHIVIVCAAHNLAPVTAHLVGASRRALSEFGLSAPLRVQVGKPLTVATQPTWIDDVLWGQIPVWMHSLLVGSVMLDSRLYGATPERTAACGEYIDMLGWIIAQSTSQ